MGIEINNHSCEKENVQGYHQWKKKQTPLSYNEMS